MSDETTDPTTNTIDVIELLSEAQVKLLSDFHFNLSEATQKAREAVDYRDFNEAQAEADRVGALASAAKSKLDEVQKAFDSAISDGTATDAALGKLVKQLTDAKTTWETYAKKSDQLSAKAEAVGKAVEAQTLNGIKAAVAAGIADYRKAKASAQVQWANKVKLNFANAIGDLKVDDKGVPNWALAWSVGTEAIKVYDRQLRALGVGARELDAAAHGVGLAFNLLEEYPRFMLPDMLMRAEAGDRAAITEMMPRAFAPVIDVPLIRNN